MGRQAKASGPTLLLQSNNRCLSCFTEGSDGGGGWLNVGALSMSGSDSKCPQSQGGDQKGELQLDAHMCVCVSVCALLHLLQLFNSSSSRTFQVEATANKWLKVQVKYVSFLSLLSRLL